MRKKKFFVGLLGATGATGKGALTLLLEYVDEIQLCIGGRNINRIKDLVQTISIKDCDNIIYDKVDLYNMDESSNFINKCDVVINCAGPYSLIGDSIINLCIENQTMLSDVSSYDDLTNVMDELDKKAKINDTLISLSAGINPGLTEMIPLYLLNEVYEKTKELRIYFAGSGALSYNAAYDIVETVGKKNNSHFVSCVKNGKIKKCNNFERKKIFRNPIGKRVIFPVINEEFFNVIKKSDADVGYYYDAYMIPLVSDPCMYDIDSDEKKQKAARILSDKTKGCKEYGIIRAEAIGYIDGEKSSRLVELFFDGAGEALTGIVAAAVGLGMINSDRNVKGCMKAYESIEFSHIIPYLKNFNDIVIIEEDFANEQ